MNDTTDISDILKHLNITELNSMQKDVVMSYGGSGDTIKDLVLLSPTGTGKTLAYMLPLVGKLNADKQEVQALVICPGRELALQSKEVFASMKTQLRPACCYGGRTAMDEHRMLKQTRAHIIFGTPGRLNDHIDKGNISTYHIKHLIIDEFDKCLEMGFHGEMKKLLKRLPAIKQRMLLSATDAQQIPDFINVNNATKLNYIDNNNNSQVAERVDIYQVKSPQKDKLPMLNCLLRHLENKSSIVFLNYRDSVERTAEYLRKQGFAACQMHGGMEQKQREDALYKFSNGSANILVATDLASRGLDIPDIDNIIHYHLPLGEEGYIHRVGRTARWNATGTTFFMLGPEEQKPDFIKNNLTDYLTDNGSGTLTTLENINTELLPPPAKPQMTTLYIGKGKKDKISKGDIVGLLCRKGGLQQHEIGRIDVKERYSYVAITNRKAHEVLKMVKGEKIKGIRTIVELVK